MNDRDPRRGRGRRHGRDRGDDGLALLCRSDDGCLHGEEHGEEEEMRSVDTKRLSRNLLATDKYEAGQP